MKIIVENETNEVKYVFSDDTVLDVGSKRITTPNFGIGDMGYDNATIYEDIDNVPEDWIGCKYLYDGSTWTLNPDYE